ncbi:ABC transporter ATP-binding protein [Desulfococcaceae bacterium OttesenSCG-928-F15]|nr:ABC transporter ATP-binding protein [Desulfococcaceae bacterium OttesenSCG-928-F15]
MGTICVTNLGKAYKNYEGRWSRLLEWLLPFSKPRHQLTWVLQHINFFLRPGEAIGIIGLNGAGKSTLLKIITGTTKPSTGSVAVTGRVTALLELGMGFHPDFTGRQNVYMSGQLIGLSVEELNRLMPDIEAFAEIGEYIDLPVRIYSSGMQVRLAFSVATIVRPDVLIVDEALSVGDAYFQHKSFNRIREFRKLGTTLLIVSHDKAAIQSLCDWAILLNKGRLFVEGEPETIMNYYNAMLSEETQHTIQQEKTVFGKTQTVSGTGEAKLIDIGLYSKKDEPVEIINVGQKVSLKCRVRVYSDLPELVLGYRIKDHLGQSVFGTNTFHMKKAILGVRTGEEYTYIFTFDANIGIGSYSISVALHTKDTHLERNFEWKDLALVFNVVNFNRDVFEGTAWLPPDLKMFK